MIRGIYVSKGNTGKRESIISKASYFMNIQKAHNNGVQMGINTSSIMDTDWTYMIMTAM
jgi:hypothetical protein